MAILLSQTKNFYILMNSFLVRIHYCRIFNPLLYRYIKATAEWGAAIADFARSRLASHHLVAIGHSAGASAV